MAEDIEVGNIEQGLAECPANECSEGGVIKKRKIDLPACIPTSVQGDNVCMGGNQTVVGGDNVGGNQTKIETLVINVAEGAQRGDTEFNLKSGKQQLMQEYKDTRSTLPLLAGMPEEFATMDDLFVNLEIVEEDKRPSGILTKKLKSCGELVCLKRQKGGRNKTEKVKRVLVRGNPGTGKSSTVSKLAYDWACNNRDSPVSDYQLLFAITINEIETDTDLIGIIQDQLLPEVSGESLRAYIQSHASSICLLLDGYDEATECFLHCRDMKNILCSKWLAEACVIVTTRVNEVGKFCQSYGTYAQVEITGFSKKGRKQYVNKFFRIHDEDEDDIDNDNDDHDHDDDDDDDDSDDNVDDDDDDDNDDDDDDDDDNNDDDDEIGGVGGRRRRCRSFLKSLRRSSQLYQLSIIPIILSMLCLLWTGDAALPTSVAALFKEVSLHLANHTVAKRKNEQQDIEAWVDKTLFHLGKVAIQGLFEDKLIFKATDFHSDLLEDACLLGVVTKERKRSRLRVTYSVTFLHKTFQEFCAAVYWGHLVDTDRQKFNQHLEQIREDNVFEMEYMLRFSCGLSVNASEIILPHVVQIMCQHSQLKQTNGVIRQIDENICQQIPLYLLHEAESNSNVMEPYYLHSLLKPLFSTIIFISEQCSNTDAFYQLFLSYLALLKPDVGIVTQFHRPWLADVERVAFRGSYKAGNVILRGFAHISNMIEEYIRDRLPNSQEAHDTKRCLADLKHNRDSDTQGADILQSGLRIEYLRLHNINISESVDNLAQAYKYMPRLKHLELRHTGLKPSHCAVLFDGLVAAGKLISHSDEMSSDVDGNRTSASQGGLSIEHLLLQGNVIGTSVDKLLQALHFMSHLRYIDVNDCGLDEKSLQNCHEVLIMINGQFRKSAYSDWWEVAESA